MECMTTQTITHSQNTNNKLHGVCTLKELGEFIHLKIVWNSHSLHAFWLKNISKCPRILRRITVNSDSWSHILLSYTASIPKSCWNLQGIHWNVRIRCKFVISLTLNRQLTQIPLVKDFICPFNFQNEIDEFRSISVSFFFNGILSVFGNLMKWIVRIFKMKIVFGSNWFSVWK